MLYLRVFGGLSLSADGEPAVGAGQQHKTLALLALVACGGPRGLSRDQLMAYIWPEADAAHARALVRQACYVLRRDLHAPDLLLGTSLLRLSPAVIGCDLWDFEAACERGDHVRAVSLYTGSFLEGFFLTEAAEFERWVDGQRSRLRRRAGAALETLAEQSTVGGDLRAAADWWTRRAALNPLNSDVALKLIAALAAAGDRGTALQSALAHRALLKAELNVDAPRALLDLVQDLQAQHAAGARQDETVRAVSPRRRRAVWRVMVAGMSLVASLAVAIRVVRPRSAAIPELGRVSAESVGTFFARVLGPDGRSICEYLPAGTVVTGRLVNAAPPPVLGGSGAFVCPQSDLRIVARSRGVWHLEVEFPKAPVLGALPWRYVETTPTVLGDAREVVIRAGIQLGGRATFEGKPVEGVQMPLGYAAFGGRSAVWGGSGPDGHWRDVMGRSPMMLQAGVRYSLNTLCRYLGARLVRAPATDAFTFPSQARSVDCALEPGPNVRFTHHRSRLVVSALPGDIGGVSEDFAREGGFGWGVQFPVAQGRTPSHHPLSSHLWQGGLLIGLAPDRVLSGITILGQGVCAGRCRSLGLDARSWVTAAPDSAKEIVWTYSGTVGRGTLLRVVQHSFDGTPGADYVLFQFAIENAGALRITFHAGFFGDWDVGQDPTNDVGSTELDGRLMYQTAGDGAGPFFGTLLAGNTPVSGNYFYRNVMVPTPLEQVNALTGRLYRPSSDAPGDNRYIHGAGPYTLAPGESGQLWLAVVAGDTKQQFLGNARAAMADIRRRRT